MTKRSLALYLFVFAILFLHIDKRSRYRQDLIQYKSFGISYHKEIVLPEKTFFLDENGLRYLKRKYIWNPALAKTANGYLMLYRMRKDYLVFPTYNPFAAYTVNEPHHLYGVFLNEKYERISKEFPVNPQRETGANIHAEDPRLIYVNDELFCFYNDQIENCGSLCNQMYLSKVVIEKNQVQFTTAMPLSHPTHPKKREKNWMPFVYEGALHIIYQTSPLEVYAVDTDQGRLSPVVTTNTLLDWSDSYISGSTNAIATNSGYVAFIHSYRSTDQILWKRRKTNYYHIGAIELSDRAPFHIKMISKSPLGDKRLYAQSVNRNKFIFPSTLLKNEERLDLFIGVDDAKILVYTVSVEELFNE